MSSLARVVFRDFAQELSLQFKVVNRKAGLPVICER
jgi:hypothetical protein